MYKFLSEFYDQDGYIVAVVGEMPWGKKKVKVVCVIGNAMPHLEGTELTCDPGNLYDSQAAASHAARHAATDI